MLNGDSFKTINLRDQQSIDVYLRPTFAPGNEDFNFDATFNIVTCATSYEISGWNVLALREFIQFLTRFTDEMEQTQFDDPKDLEVENA